MPGRLPGTTASLVRVKRVTVAAGLPHKRHHGCEQSAPPADTTQWLYDWSETHWPEVAAVRVSEAPKTWAEYHP